ncbi:MAG TPA: TlpA disulfide reductase family protein [Bacillales bacterium]|nr:TlpA disulfide reductase family protein [Bacillales bacterium]
MTQLEKKEKAPEFSLLDYQTGRLVSLEDFRGRTMLITFWVSWCPDCLKDLPKKETFYQATSTRDDFSMVTINVTGREGDPDDGVRFAEEQAFSFPVLRDQDLLTYEAYGCNSVPYTVLLNRDHEITHRFDDKASFMDIALAVEQMLHKK